MNFGRTKKGSTSVQSGPDIPDTSAVRPSVRALLALAGLGVLIRLLFLFAAGDTDPFADEVNYIYLGLCLTRYGFYSDCVRYLWPPGYATYLSVFLRLFQADGVFYAKLCQVLLSGVIGYVIMLLAQRIFSRKAALLAGVIWCIYVPLIAFTHYNWPETVFLAIFMPSMYLLLSWWSDTEGGSTCRRRLLAAGLLFGLALLVKEAVLYLGVLLALLIIWRLRRISWTTGVSHAAVFVLSAVVVVLPWSLRNYEVYGRIAPVGATIGENCYQGVLRPYASFDYPQIDYAKLYGDDALLYRWFIAPPAGPVYKRAVVPNVIDRSAENVRQTRELVRAHPGWFARGRVKRVANWVAPTSFFVRHHALRRYEGALESPLLRRPLLVLSVFTAAAVTALALPGVILCLRQPVARSLVACTLLYFLVTALLVGMSRHRASAAPLLIVLAAGFLSGAGRPWLSRRLAVVSVATSWLVLGLLWMMNYKEVELFLKIAW